MDRRVDAVVVPSSTAPGLLSLRGEDGRHARAVLTSHFECGDVVTVIQRHDVARLERVFALTQKFLYRTATDRELDELIELTDPQSEEVPQSTKDLRGGAP